MFGKSGRAGLVSSRHFRFCAEAALSVRSPFWPVCDVLNTLPMPADRASSLLKNIEMESFLFLDDGCWGGAVELDVIFSAGVGYTLTRGG
jgi:hypothetical protein